MIDVELSRDALPVHIVNVDQLWALKSRLEVFLSHVVGDEADHLGLARVVERLEGSGHLRAQKSSRQTPVIRRASACSGTCTIQRRPL